MSIAFSILIKPFNNPRALGIGCMTSDSFIIDYAGRVGVANGRESRALRNIIIIRDISWTCDMIEGGTIMESLTSSARVCNPLVHKITA